MRNVNELAVDHAIVADQLAQVLKDLDYCWMVLTDFDLVNVVRDPEHVYECLLEDLFRESDRYFALVQELELTYNALQAEL